MESHLVILLIESSILYAVFELCVCYSGLICYCSTPFSVSLVFRRCFCLVSCILFIHLSPCDDCYILFRLFERFVLVHGFGIYLDSNFINIHYSRASLILDDCPLVFYLELFIECCFSKSS